MKVPYFREKFFGCLEKGQTKIKFVDWQSKTYYDARVIVVSKLSTKKDDSLDASEYQFTIFKNPTYTYLIMKLKDGATTIFTKIYMQKYCYWWSYARKGGGGKFIFIMKLVASPLASTLLKWLYPSASEDNILLNW